MVKPKHNASKKNSKTAGGGDCKTSGDSGGKSRDNTSQPPPHGGRKYDTKRKNSAVGKRRDAQQGVCERNSASSEPRRRGAVLIENQMARETTPRASVAPTVGGKKPQLGRTAAGNRTNQAQSSPQQQPAQPPEQEDKDYITKKEDQDYITGSTFEELVQQSLTSGVGHFQFGSEREWLQETPPSSAALDLSRLASVLSSVCPRHRLLGMDRPLDETAVCDQSDLDRSWLMGSGGDSDDELKRCVFLECQCGHVESTETEIRRGLEHLRLQPPNITDSSVSVISGAVSRECLQETRVKPAHTTSVPCGNSLMDNDWLDSVLSSDDEVQF